MKNWTEQIILSKQWKYSQNCIYLQNTSIETTFKIVTKCIYPCNKHTVQVESWICLVHLFAKSNSIFDFCVISLVLVNSVFCSYAVLLLISLNTPVLVLSIRVLRMEINIRKIYIYDNPHPPIRVSTRAAERRTAATTAPLAATIWRGIQEQESV